MLLDKCASPSFLTACTVACWFHAHCGQQQNAAVALCADVLDQHATAKPDQQSPLTTHVHGQVQSIGIGTMVGCTLLYRPMPVQGSSTTPMLPPHGGAYVAETFALSRFHNIQFTMLSSDLAPSP